MISAFRAIDGGWGEWSDWSPCSHACGTNGTQWRMRTCSKPSPSGNGLPCSGHAKEFRQCNVFACECKQNWKNLERIFGVTWFLFILASWSCWRDYTPCSVTCGTGYRERVRTCNQPAPGAKNCVGNRTERVTCDAGPCTTGKLYTGITFCNNCVVHNFTRFLFGISTEPFTLIFEGHCLVIA